MHKAVQLWKSAFTDQTSTTQEPRYCIIWLSGSAGMGKSTVLRKFHEDLSLRETTLNIGKIIDWSILLNDEYSFLHFMQHGIDQIKYIYLLRMQMSQALNKELHAFKEFEVAAKSFDMFLQGISTIARNVHREDTHALSIREYPNARKITKEKLVELLRWYASSGQFMPNYGEINSTLSRFLGEDIHLEISFLQALYEDALHKVGPHFHEYLQPGNFLGAALGHDLQTFSKVKPVLLFFDTYECIEKESHLLQVVIEAAGTSVGWLISGRSQPTIVSRQEHYAAGIKMPQQNTLVRDAIIPIVFEAKGTGSFSPAEIVTYFKQIHKQKSSLPAVKMLDAQRIWEATQGIPLAVSIAAAIYMQSGQIDAIIVGKEGMREIVRQMVIQYLSYVTLGKKERIILYGLAMLRRTDNWQVISSLLGANTDQEKSLEEQLSILLHTTYGIFIQYGQLSFHQEIRYFLRFSLLEQPTDPVKQAVARQLQTFLQARLDDLEVHRPYTKLADRFEDNEWVSAYLDLIEAQFWIDAGQGLCYCLPFLLASWIYQRDLLDDILAVGNFFSSHMLALHSRQWTYITQGFQSTNPPGVEEKEQFLIKIEQLLLAMAQKIPFPLAQYGPELQGALDWKRASLYRDRQQEKALYWYQKALQHLPTHDTLQQAASHTCWLLALDLYAKQDYSVCLDRSLEVLKIKFDFADANYLRGNAYSERAEYNLAVIEYQYTLAFDEKHILAAIHLGDAYVMSQAYQEAIDQYSKAIALEPDSALLRYNRAVAYAALTRYETAVEDYDVAIFLQPDFAWAYVNRGNLHAYLRKDELARADYAQAFRLAPHDMQIAWMMLWANLKDRQSLDLKRVEEVMALEPDYYLAHICRGICLAFQSGAQPMAFTLALKEMDQAITMESEQWDHYFWKGMIYGYWGDAVNAEITIQQALDKGLPPMLLSPLRWLETVFPHFFASYVLPLLKRFNL